MFVIKGAEDYYNKKVDRASVGLKVQDNKLIVSLNTPIKNFDEWVSNPIFYPIRKENRDLNLDKKIVNGAFKVSSFTDDEIILERNENYLDNVTNVKLTDIFPESERVVEIMKNSEECKNLSDEELKNDIAKGWMLAHKIGRAHV